MHRCAAQILASVRGRSSLELSAEERKTDAPGLACTINTQRTDTMAGQAGTTQTTARRTVCVSDQRDP